MRPPVITVELVDKDVMLQGRRTGGSTACVRGEDLARVPRSPAGALPLLEGAGFAQTTVGKARSAVRGLPGIGWINATTRRPPGCGPLR